VNFFVTGGSRGIGAAIVLQAVREGHDVAFTYVHNAGKAAEVCAQALAIRPGARCRAHELDAGNSAMVEKVADAVLDEFDSIDVVVSNAGINKNNLVVSMSDDEWESVIRTNLTGAFYVCRQFLPSMLANRFGRIILVSSLGHSGVSGQANYCASKAGLHGLCSALAKEYGRRGITANLVVPGFFDTDMTREGMSESNKSFWLQYCPAGRMGGLDEIAKTTTFLASDGAGFINGQAIPVNGGLDWAP
jgi:NAD(P)-dependent dehydrogenase (short-subunit alcohol dehydrogenase family)